MAQKSNDIYAFIGARINQERKTRGFTLEELASAAGMNTSFLHYIEKNKKRPSLGMVQRIAEALKIPIEQLFRDAPAKYDSESGLARKVGFILRDTSPNKRAMIMRVVKSLAKKN